MSVEAIFEAMPVEESTQAPSEQATESVKNMGDRVRKGDMGSRIEAFGEMLEDDNYGGKPKEHEPVKVEKPSVAPTPKENKEEDQEPKEKKEVLVQDKPKEEPPKVDSYKVKVDGQDLEVSLEDLKKSYSGDTAIRKRFNELNIEKKSFEKEKVQVLADGKRMQEEIGILKGGFESAINEYNKNGFTVKNPLNFVDELLDKIGVDSYAYNRAVFEHNLPEYAKFFEMDDVQRDAYFAKKENEFLRKKDQGFTERTKQAQVQQERQRQEFNLIKQSGLSIDEFNQNFEELKDLGSDDMSVERVLEFAKVKPIFDKAGGIVSQTQRAGDVSLIQDVSRLLMEFPNTTEEEIIESITGKKAAKDVSKKLNGKENYTVDVSNIAKKSKGENDLSDEEMEMFRQIRRR